MKNISTTRQNIAGLSKRLDAFKADQARMNRLKQSNELKIFLSIAITNLVKDKEHSEIITRLLMNKFIQMPTGKNCPEYLTRLADLAHKMDLSIKNELYDLLSIYRYDGYGKNGENGIIYSIRNKVTGIFGRKEDSLKTLDKLIELSTNLWPEPQEKVNFIGSLILTEGAVIEAFKNHPVIQSDQKNQDFQRCIGDIYVNYGEKTISFLFSTVA